MSVGYFLCIFLFFQSKFKRRLYYFLTYTRYGIEKMAALGELWVSWFGCCVTQPQKRRHRIDRSMIGEPTNFIHTGHIGQRDVENSEEKLVVVWNQMRSKGGYNMSYQIPSVVM